MSGYILSILGIVIMGVFIDIIIPTGTISKYIKSIYSIFIVAVLLMPIIKFFNKSNALELVYKDFELQENLMLNISQRRIDNLELEIENYLTNEGFSLIDIELEFSIENNELTIKSCRANLENMSSSTDKQHINKYEFIAEVVNKFTNLKAEDIKISE